MDINKLTIPSADPNWPRPTELKDNSYESNDKSICVYFRNIENKLIEYIAEAECVLGCVAWLTSKPILKALEEKRGVSIIVQKEDFLRRDLNAGEGWEQDIQKLYTALYPKLTRREIGGYLQYMRNKPYRSMTEEYERQWFIEDPMDPIRCVGNCQKNEKRSQPIAHHKFILFCKYNESQYAGMSYVEPYAVWTGSFNFSFNATKSFENAVVLRAPKVISAFFNEYIQIACLSEPLDWSSAEPSPEWGLGD